MPRPPSFPMYPADLIRDTRMLSIAAKGIWIEVLAHGHFSKNRGEVTGSPETLSRCFGCSVDELLSAVDEIESCGVGDVQRSGNLTQPNGNLTPPNSNLTITNRRMAREANAKQGNANRQKAWYDKHHPNKALTPEKPLPSSSSSSSKEKESLRRDSKKKEAAAETALNLFTLFWDNYPPRNGKKLDKEMSKAAFFGISKCKQGQVAGAAANYRKSEQVQDGVGIKDPKRFLAKGYWEQWIEPEDAGRDLAGKNKVAIQQFLTGGTS